MIKNLLIQILLHNHWISMYQCRSLLVTYTSIHRMILMYCLPCHTFSKKINYNWFFKLIFLQLMLELIQYYQFRFEFTLDSHIVKWLNYSVCNCHSNIFVWFRNRLVCFFFLHTPYHFHDLDTKIIVWLPLPIDHRIRFIELLYRWKKKKNILHEMSAFYSFTLCIWIEEAMEYSLLSHKKIHLKNLYFVYLSVTENYQIIIFGR